VTLIRDSGDGGGAQRVADLRDGVVEQADQPVQGGVQRHVDPVAALDPGDAESAVEQVVDQPVELVDQRSGVTQRCRGTGRTTDPRPRRVADGIRSSGNG
jgi:hypothetical protein